MATPLRNTPLFKHPNLRAYFPLNGNTTPMAGTGLTVSVVKDIVWDAGLFGQSAKFSGGIDTNVSQIQISGGGMTAAAGFTVSHWIKSNSWSGGLYCRIGDSMYAPGFWLNAGGVYVMSSWRSSGDRIQVNLPATGVWHHSCLTFDGVTTTWYLNGRPSGSTFSNFSYIDHTYWNIGYYIGWTGKWSYLSFNGWQCDWAMFSAALTAQEVWTLYKGTDLSGSEAILAPRSQTHRRRTMMGAV
jgi:hypothetical protein